MPRKQNENYGGRQLVIRKSTKYFINIGTSLFILLAILFLVFGQSKGIFHSTDTFTEYIISFGIWSRLLFILFQIIQVVIPFLPSGIICVTGVLAFGPIAGLIYNYIGICIGSMIAFLLSKRYGSQFVKVIVGKKYYTKYINWVEKGNKFDKAFALAIFFPIAPDDILCYIAGLTKMKFTKFVLILLLAKPMTISIYTLGITSIGYFLLDLLK